MNDTKQTPDPRIALRLATADDAGLILDFIRQLAEYENLTHEVVTDVDQLRQSLFGERRVAEVVIASYDGEPAGFALFFHNFSTFLGLPGIYLEDLFVIPKLRGHGIGQVLPLAPGRDCGQARLRPTRVGGARLEHRRHPPLRTPRGKADGRVDRVPDHG
jgi:GNAT superfamily N-acetyltransferase